MKLTLEQLIAARNALDGPFEIITMEDVLEEFADLREAAESLKLDIRDSLLRDDIRRERETKLDVIHDLHNAINALIEDEEEHLDWYHLMDSMDDEDQLIDELKEHLESMRNQA